MLMPSRPKSAAEPWCTTKTGTQATTWMPVPCREELGPDLVDIDLKSATRLRHAKDSVNLV